MTDIEKILEEAKAGILPFESWERLTGESGAAYAAFCCYRDFGADRNIRKAAVRYADSSESDGIGGVGTEQHQGSKPSNSTQAAKRYRVWRLWSMRFRWRERAEAYDQYLDRMKQTELRKTIEEQGKVHRMVTGKMLEVVNKKLDMMNPEDLSQGTVTEWVETAIKADRVAAELASGAGKVDGETGKPGQITFTPDFENL
jgi:hypothetical protein